MFERLFCKHNYKFYNTKVEYSFSNYYRYNDFQFVCTKCGKETSVSEIEIDDMFADLKSSYKKSLVLGGDAVKTSELTIPRHRNCDILYRSPVTTVMLDEYAKRGIDLKQIDKSTRRW